MINKKLGGIRPGLLLEILAGAVILGGCANPRFNEPWNLLPEIAQPAALTRTYEENRERERRDVANVQNNERLNMLRWRMENAKTKEEQKEIILYEFNMRIVRADNEQVIFIGTLARGLNYLRRDYNTHGGNPSEGYKLFSAEPGLEREFPGRIYGSPDERGFHIIADEKGKREVFYTLP